MKWSKDILNDIYYQRKILSNPVATFFTKNWSVGRSTRIIRNYMRQVNGVKLTDILFYFRFRPSVRTHI